MASRARGALLPRLLSVCALLLLMSGAIRGLAEDVRVPISLQAELMTKIAAYDSNLSARAAGTVKVRILTYGSDVTSRAIAAELTSALAAIPTVAGLPHEEATVDYTDAAALAKACAADHVFIVYLTPGITTEQVGALVQALDGVSVMTVAAEPRLVPQGVVLGFDLVASKPKLLVHLTQARRQQRGAQRQRRSSS